VWEPAAPKVLRNRMAKGILRSSARRVVEALEDRRLGDKMSGEVVRFVHVLVVQRIVGRELRNGEFESAVLFDLKHRDVEPMNLEAGEGKAKRGTRFGALMGRCALAMTLNQCWHVLAPMNLHECQHVLGGAISLHDGACHIPHPLLFYATRDSDPVEPWLDDLSHSSMITLVTTVSASRRVKVTTFHRWWSVLILSLWGRDGRL